MERAADAARVARGRVSYFSKLIVKVLPFLPLLPHWPFEPDLTNLSSSPGIVRRPDKPPSVRWPRHSLLGRPGADGRLGGHMPGSLTQSGCFKLFKFTVKP